MIIRYSLSSNDIVMYYYNERGQVLTWYGSCDKEVPSIYSSLSHVRWAWAGSAAIIHDDGAP